MFVCAGASVCVGGGGGGGGGHALRIGSRDKILHFKNNFIIIIKTPTYI